MPNGTSMVTCTNPHYGVSKVTFETFGSLHVLYAKYVASVRSRSGGRFEPNVGDCNLHQTLGEVSWNHNFHHPRKYSVAQVESGRLSEDDAAAGRVFCTFAKGNYVLVWTQNAGKLLGVLFWAPHEDAWLWWYKVHHEIALPGGSMDMKH